MSLVPRRTIWITNGSDPPIEPKRICRVVPSASLVKTQGNRNVENDLRNVPSAPPVRDKPKSTTSMLMNAH